MYDEVETYSRPFSDGLTPVGRNGRWGFINRTGAETVPCKYGKIGNFIEELALVRLNGKYGYVDTGGKEVIPCKYDDASDFSGGCARVKRNGKYGFIDHSGDEIIPCIYDAAKKFPERSASGKSDGHTSVKLNGYELCIDKTGNYVKEFLYLCRRIRNIKTDAE
jgi:hypothetical protein